MKVNDFSHRPRYFCLDRFHGPVLGEHDHYRVRNISGVRCRWLCSLCVGHPTYIILELAWEEGRDAASVIIELDTKSFVEKLFFGADANAVR
jgi:hypothetical protein